MGATPLPGYTRRLTRAGLLSGIGTGAAVLAFPGLLARPDACAETGTRGGWRKYSGGPVLGGTLGTCFDACLLRDGAGYRMWFSWRPRASIAMTESRDGMHWSRPRIALAPRPSSGWEESVNRPIVIHHDGLYRMWYTGQTNSGSAIGYAISQDGLVWRRMGRHPVLAPREPWEMTSVMCPHVLWDQRDATYRMWYSGGHTFEPDAIGYATSADGLSWRRYSPNPVFRSDPHATWESQKVTACQVVRHGGWHLMFYIGFCSELRAHIGLARSRDGIVGWERHPLNPIIGPGPGDTWDRDAVYKPFALPGAHDWTLWYNGRRNGDEQIGLATHQGLALW